MADSIRLQILTAIQERFKEEQFSEFYSADLDPNAKDPISIPTVGLGPLTDADHRKRYAIGVVPGKESFTDVYPFFNCFLPIAIEFRVTVNKGDEKPGVMAERLLTVVEKAVLRDGEWGELAMDTTITGNEIDVNSYVDKAVEGVLFIEVQYRTSRRDPTSTEPSDA